MSAKDVADKLLGRTAALREVHSTSHTIRMLETCTAHVAKHTADALTADTLEYLSSTKYFEYGWIIYAGEYDQLAIDELKADGHGALLALLDFAREEGFQFLKLDCDSTYLPPELGFETFQW